jgi:urea transport system permease protein
MEIVLGAERGGLRPASVSQEDDSRALRTPPEILAFRRRVTAGLLVLLFVVAPGLSLAGVIEPYTLNRLGRYLCFAIAALGIDLIWGYAGVLSLCHAVFFCLGGYAIAMHLSLVAGGGDVRPEYNNIPQFFFFNNVDVLPAWWSPFESLPVAALVAILLPGTAAALFGFVIFRNRVRGVYFSIITQALAWGAFLAFSRNELLLGGTNGLTNFYKPLNSEMTWILGLYLATATALVLAFVGCQQLVESRFGRLLIAIRDCETRLYFLGYRPEVYKAAAFAVAAVLAAVAGALYVPQNGIVTPNVMRVEDSIWMVIWVAVGGRGTLWGAVAGALLANFTYSMLTSDLPKAWPFIQAGLFMAVLPFPSGLAHLWSRLESELQAGAVAGRALLVCAFVLTFLIVDKVGWLPSALSINELLGMQAKYWVLMVAAAALSWARVAPTAVPLLGVAGAVVAEAFGLLPGAARLLTYATLAVLTGYYVARDGHVVSRLTGLRSHFGWLAR